MKSRLRLVLPIFAVLLFVGSCLADTVTLTFSSIGEATSNSSTFRQSRRTNSSPSFSGNGVWSNELSESGFTHTQNYEAALLGSGRDNSAWTAGNHGITNRALDSTSEFRIYPIYGNAPERGPLGFMPECHREPPPVPEPSTYLMLGSGLVMLALLLRGRFWRRRTS
jgi:hypothetical protein